MADEPKIATRQRTFLKGTLYFDNRRASIECVVRDISNSGARLTFDHPANVPDNVELFIPNKQQTLRARVQRTIEYLKTIPASAFDGAEDRDIKIPVRERTLEMKGLPYLRTWALPNFYFHVVTTYAILRHNGVDIGKRDYLGALSLRAP